MAVVMAEPRREKIPGHGGKYSVDEEGSVFRHFKNCTRMLKQTVTVKGYSRVQLRTPKKSYYVQRLVALVFCNPPENWEDLHVRHMDGNSLNNHATNLRWGTHEENIDDRNHHNRVRQHFDIRQRIDIETRFELGHSVDEICAESNYDREVVQEMWERWDDADWTF